MRSIFNRPRRRTAAIAVAILSVAAVSMLTLVDFDVSELAAAGRVAVNPELIEKGPTMRRAGSHTFSALRGAKDVTWSVDREERRELEPYEALSSEGERLGQWRRTANVATARGAKATFDLQKPVGYETVYVIRARRGNQLLGDVQRVQVFAPNAHSNFLYESPGNPPVPVFITVPASLSSATHLVVVMHGKGRNAEGYCDAWHGWAVTQDYIAVCPKFDVTGWPEPFQGNVFADRNGEGAKNPENKWTFTIVDDLQRIVRQRFGLRDTTYDLYGHSGGGQFVHRFMLFKPHSPIRFGIAANPGFYTLPDLKWRYPYGAGHPKLAFAEQDLVAWTNRQMIIMRGCLDIDRDEDLNTTRLADAQGSNRFERAAYMFDKGKSLNPGLRWQLRNVPGAGHSNGEMAPAAQSFLKSPDQPALSAPVACGRSFL